MVRLMFWSSDSQPVIRRTDSCPQILGSVLEVCYTLYKITILQVAFCFIFRVNDLICALVHILFYLLRLLRVIMTFLHILITYICT